MTFEQIIDSCLKYNSIHLVHIHGDMTLDCMKLLKLLKKYNYV